MAKFVLALIILSISLAAYSDGNMIQVFERPNRQAICQCSYYLQRGEGHQGELVFNRSCDPAESHEVMMKIDGQITILKCSNCTKSEEKQAKYPLSQEWVAPRPKISVRVELSNPEVGTEATHSFGKLTLRRGEYSEEVYVIAGCGI